MPAAAVVLFNFSNSSYVHRVIELLKSNFNLDSEVIHPLINPSEFYSSERDQYYSTKILEKVIRAYDDRYDKILTLTDHDLFVPVLTFVFGEAQLTGKAAIVSSHRLHQEFYGLPSDDEVLLQRLEKEVLHEIGHTFGLKHCIDWNCVMHSSSNVDEIDIKPKDFCKTCSKKIPSL